MVEQNPKIVKEKLSIYPKVFAMCNWSIMGAKEVQLAASMEKLIPVVDPIPRTGRIISKSAALSQSQCYLSLIGKSYVGKIINKEKGIEIENINAGYYDYSTSMRFITEGSTNLILVHSIKTPKVLDGLSPLMLGHEHIHCFKETNPKEYKDSYTYGEVIPMFFELQMSDVVSDEERKSLVRNRLANLKTNYLLASKNESIIFRDINNFSLYPYFITDKMRYLHSYYYSLLLYEMYLEDKELVLSRVRDVLDGTKATKEILDELGLISSFDPKKAKDGIAIVKNKI